MEEEISLREVLSIFKKYIRLMIILPLGLMIASGFISFIGHEKEYRTHTTLMISRSEEPVEVLVPTYSEMIKTSVVADEVMEELNLTLSHEQFRNKVEITHVSDTELIQIVATDSNAVIAADIANQTAEVFKESIVDILNLRNVRVRVIDEAQVPASPINSISSLNIAVAGVLGFMIAIFIAFIREYFDNTMKTPEDVEKYLGVPVLGMIPKED